MPQVSIYWLNEYTYKDRRTIKKRLANLPKDKHGKYDSGAAFEAIYCGQFTDLDGEFVSTQEAVRRLTIAKKAQIDLDMEIKRGLRIPKEDVDRACNLVFKAIAGIIKANRNKMLTDTQINEIFDMMRATSHQLQKEHGGNGSVLVQDAD